MDRLPFISLIETVIRTYGQYRVIMHVGTVEGHMEPNQTREERANYTQKCKEFKV